MRFSNIALFTAGLLLSSQTLANSKNVTEAAARALHEQILTIDTHVDIGRGYATHLLDPGGFTKAQVDLPKMRAGGLDAVFLIVYAAQGALTAEAYQLAANTAEHSYQAIMRMIRAYPEQVGLARTADDVEALHKAGKRIVLLGMENAYPLGDSIKDVPKWAERGIRYVGLTHIGHNQFSGSSNPRADLNDSENDPGLSALGRQLVKALNQHGILIDVSHVGKKSMLEAIKLSTAPVIASHSSAMSVHANLRNLDDEQLDALKANGGVAQMVAFRSYVAELDPALAAAISELRQQYLPNGWANANEEQRTSYDAKLTQLRSEHPDVTLAQFVDHIDYAVNRIGIEHVGIASDFDGGGGVEGWNDASETLNVTWELMRRGYTKAQIQALWGGNVLRILRQAEQAAKN
ncbi:dipeptidase [Alishewanella longhuensis]